MAKLDSAATLLARSSYAIGAISALQGFANPFHFSRCFKAAYGQSPRALRQEIEAGATPPTSRLLHLGP